MLTFLTRREKRMQYHFSGYSEFEYPGRQSRLAREEYLLKPVSIDVLQETLERIERNCWREKQYYKNSRRIIVRNIFFWQRQGEV